MIARIILLLVILLNANISFAGISSTNLTSTLSVYDLSSGWSSSSAISKKDQERRFELIKKIEAIQKQFEEEERRLTMGMTKDEIEKMYRHAMDVLAGASVVCSSEIIGD